MSCNNEDKVSQRFFSWRFLGTQPNLKWSLKK